MNLIFCKLKKLKRHEFRCFFSNLNKLKEEEFKILRARKLKNHGLNFCKLQNSRKDKFNFRQAKNSLILCKLKNAQKSYFTYYNLY